MKTKVAMKSLKRQRKQASAFMKTINYRFTTSFNPKRRVGSILVEVVIGG